MDRVVGKDRLPDFRVLNSVPYWVSTIRKAVRWNPTTPIGKLLPGPNVKLVSVTLRAQPLPSKHVARMEYFGVKYKAGEQVV